MDCPPRRTCKQGAQQQQAGDSHSFKLRGVSTQQPSHGVKILLSILQHTYNSHSNKVRVQSQPWTTCAAANTHVILMRSVAFPIRCSPNSILCTRVNGRQG
jgi:hypothetical protein